MGVKVGIVGSGSIPTRCPGMWDWWLVRVNRRAPEVQSMAAELTRGGTWGLLRRSESEVPSDAALLARASGGDRDALGELYDRHSTSAYSLAARLVGATAAADVVHDTFVALLEKPATFDPTLGSFRAWFMTTIHHRCLNLLRHNRPTVGEDALLAVVTQDPEPVDEIVRRLQDASVRDALRALPPEQREALVLAYYGGLSQTAIAERLGTPLGTVKARMRRGLLSLRGLLRGEAAGIDEEAIE